MFKNLPIELPRNKLDLFLSYCFTGCPRGTIWPTSILNHELCFCFSRGGHYNRSVSVTGGSWKDPPSSPAVGAGSRVVGITSADLGQLNCSQYLKDNGNNSPMSTGSSTASGSKRLNGTSSSSANVASRTSSATQNIAKSAKKKVTTNRTSRRRSRSSNSDSDSSAAGGGSRSSSSSSSSSRSSSSSSSSTSSRSDAAETRSRSPSPSSSSRKRSQNKASLPVPFEERTHCAICIRNPPARPSGKKRHLLLLLVVMLVQLIE